MSLILSLETSTSVCSVALHKNGELQGNTTIFGEKTHSHLITVLIENLIKNCGFQLSDLNAIAVGKGPGSYTGLRIGVSTAKGLCFALEKPLIGVNTLEAMAKQVIDYYPDKDAYFCPMIDARRMEVYCGIWDEKMNLIAPTSALILDETSFSEFLDKKDVIFFGNGAEKLKKLLPHQPNARFIDNIHPAATSVGLLASPIFEEKQFEDVAYFEPFYLKDFIGNMLSASEKAK
jgi:tRNA threonylcarbamoyladenosine biosynthesis protein TsaB